MRSSKHRVRPLYEDVSLYTMIIYCKIIILKLKTQEDRMKAETGENIFHFNTEPTNSRRKIMASHLYKGYNVNLKELDSCPNEDQEKFFYKILEINHSPKEK